MQCAFRGGLTYGQDVHLWLLSDHLYPGAIPKASNFGLLDISIARYIPKPYSGYVGPYYAVYSEDDKPRPEKHDN